MSMSLMSLDQCHLIKLQIDARSNPGSIKELGYEASMNILYQMRQHNERLHFFIPMSITMTWEEDSPSYFDKLIVGLGGVFSFPEGTDDDEIQKYVPFLCLTNLYGIARGILMSTTGMCAGGPIILPVVNMIEAVKNAIRVDDPFTDKDMKDQD